MKRMLWVFTVLLVVLAVCVGCNRDNTKNDDNTETEDIKMNGISETVKKFVKFLGCDCSYVGPGEDMAAVIKAYYTALEKVRPRALLR